MEQSWRQLGYKQLQTSPERELQSLLLTAFGTVASHPAHAWKTYSKNWARSIRFFCDEQKQDSSCYSWTEESRGKPEAGVPAWDYRFTEARRMLGDRERGTWTRHGWSCNIIMKNHMAHRRDQESSYLRYWWFSGTRFSFCASSQKLLLP